MSYEKDGSGKKIFASPIPRPAPPLLAKALAHYRSGRLAEAEQLCRNSLAVHPHNADSLHLLGLIARKAGHHDRSVDLIRKAIGLDASVAAYHFNLGLVLMDQRKHGEAAASYRKAIDLKPDYARAYINLGNALRESDQLEEAEACYRRALALKPDYAEAHNNLGNVLWQQNRLEEAAANFDRALLLKPDFVEVRNNLGNVLQDQGKFSEAAAAYRGVLARKPDFAAAHNNLGNVLGKLGGTDEAMDCYRRALALEPNYAMAHNNLGNAFKERGETDQAIASYSRALDSSPDFAEAHFNLARALKEQGKLAEAEASFLQGLAIRPDSPIELADIASTLMMQDRLVEAFEVIRHSLRIRDTEYAKRVFVSCIKNSDRKGNFAELQDLMIRALTEPWGRPSDLAQTCAGFLKHDPQIGPAIARATDAWPEYLPANMLFGPNGPAAFADNPLFEALLSIAPNADIGMERFLTSARRLLLEAAMTGTVTSPALDFYGALARQCFINEYVFYAEQKEIEDARVQFDSVAALLNSNRAVPALHLLAVAAYFPLYSVPLASRLLSESWPESVLAVLAQQIRQPEEERRLRAEIRKLTDVEDETSKLVQGQYEENPYPRWVKAAPVEAAESLAGYLNRKFPLTVSHPRGETQRFEILIAGCGTGQHSVETAQRFPKARILAVDLSANSLGYASYKSQHLGLASIEYAQADIMALGGLGGRFDLVESVGVLHHLGDAFAGWRVLLSLVAPGGFMRLGLYSEMARENIAKARAFIAERGYGTSANDVRRARQDVVAWANRTASEAIINSPDFFSVSGCRDLILHAQEQCVTLASIAAFLKENNLTFLGFDLGSDMTNAYRRRFPHDSAAVDLDQWEIFERENPTTFASMYQFWVRKLS